MTQDRVLVLDDDRAIRETMALSLELEDYAVRSASDLNGGVALLASEPFDLVVADLFASRFSPAAVGALQALGDAAPGTPIVLATGFAEARSIEPQDYGLAGILVKPFDLDDLLLMVRGAIDEQRARTERTHVTVDKVQRRIRSAREHIETSASLLRRLGALSELE